MERFGVVGGMGSDGGEAALDLSQDQLRTGNGKHQGKQDPKRRGGDPASAQFAAQESAENGGAGPQWQRGR